MSPSAPNAPPKRKLGGLYVLLGIIGVGALLFLAVAGYVGWRIYSSPEGRARMGQIGGALSLASKAQKAPGTKELRAAGCGQALVMSFDDIAAIAGLDAGARDRETLPFGETVVCAGKPLRTAPTCEDVARTYVKAVGERPQGFLVTVSRGGTGREDCSALFDKTGTFVADGKDPFRGRGVPAPVPSDDDPPDDGE